MWTVSFLNWPEAEQDYQDFPESVGIPESCRHHIRRISFSLSQATIWFQHGMLWDANSITKLSQGIGLRICCNTHAFQTPLTLAKDALSCGTKSH